MLKSLVIGSLILVFLSGCGKFSLQSSQISIQLEDKVECRDFEKLLLIELHQATLEQRNPGSWTELKSAFKNSKSLNVEKTIGVIDLLERHLTDSFWTRSPSEQAEVWAQLELQVGPPELVQQLKTHFKKYQSQAAQNCEVNFPAPTEPALPEPMDLVRGARKVMQLAYQSCEATQISALDSAVPATLGIAVVGTHPDKIGSVRKIKNLNLVQKTHPYLRIQNKGSECFDVMSQPLIYDYGGKPAYTSASALEIDLFKNNGSGSQELGIDCSAFVVASLGLSGLRLRPNENFLARHTAAFGTSTLVKFPEFFPCLDYISIGKDLSITAGDIVTVVGHTLIIDSVGPDPFGISGLQSESACKALDGSKFDFTISHSSPVYGAVGINRMQARDYMKGSSKMAAGILKYAKAQCLQGFRNSSTKPRWSDVSIVRHKKTPECRGPALTARHQRCVETCTDVAFGPGN